MNEKKKILKSFPYHPFRYEINDVINSINNNTVLTEMQLRIMKERLETEKRKSDNILSSGLLIDEEYNVFINSEYGAFFYNTKCKTIEEEIISCKEMPPIMNCHVYVPEEELLDYIEKGYEFVMGPSVKIFDDDNDSLNGVYCVNYKKVLVNRR